MKFSLNALTHWRGRQLARAAEKAPKPCGYEFYNGVACELVAGHAGIHAHFGGKYGR